MKNILLIICLIVLRLLITVINITNFNVWINIILTYICFIFGGWLEYNILCKWFNSKKLIRVIVIIQVLIFAVAYLFYVK